MASIIDKEQKAVVAGVELHRGLLLLGYIFAR
jgi:hypothetical protein